MSSHGRCGYAVAQKVAPVSAFSGRLGKEWALLQHAGVVCRAWKADEHVQELVIVVINSLQNDRRPFFSVDV